MSTKTTVVVPFQFESSQVRTIYLDNHPWFVAKDVAVILGYKNISDAIAKHCKGVAKRYPLETRGGIQDARIINEPDLYRLITHSQLPAAERFERWVFEEVLPTIHRTGQYQAHPQASAERKPTTRMSSREIAELTSKRHDNVLRDVKSLINQGALHALSFEETSQDVPMPNGGTRTEHLYLLDFHATLTLVTGYNAVLRSRVIARWLELEREEQQRQQASSAASRRGWKTSRQLAKEWGCCQKIAQKRLREMRESGAVEFYRPRNRGKFILYRMPVAQHSPLPLPMPGDLNNILAKAREYVDTNREAWIFASITHKEQAQELDGLRDEEEQALEQMIFMLWYIHYNAPKCIRIMLEGMHGLRDAAILRESIDRMCKIVSK